MWLRNRKVLSGDVVRKMITSLNIDVETCVKDIVQKPIKIRGIPKFCKSLLNSILTKSKLWILAGSPQAKSHTTIRYLRYLVTINGNEESRNFWTKLTWSPDYLGSGNPNSIIEDQTLNHFQRLYLKAGIVIVVYKAVRTFFAGCKRFFSTRVTIVQLKKYM